ncbi:hypothetical protein TNCV_1218781 [Trichonephila clavipes]|nr:hypothetical protein TNCV_1218781 [Trichonephila clavipes]
MIQNHKGIQSRKCRSRDLVQRSREKEQKQQYINGTENILLKSRTTTDVRKSSDFFWGHMKSLASENPVPSVKHLNIRISVAAERIRGMPGIFQN